MCSDEFPEKPPITDVGITDDGISEMAVDIDDCLSYGWGTEMSNMEWFPDVCTDIIDDYCFLFHSPLSKGDRGILL